MKPEMIQGNKSMPVPSDLRENSLHTDIGAFRITLIDYSFICTERHYFNHISYVLFTIFLGK